MKALLTCGAYDFGGHPEWGAYDCLVFKCLCRQLRISICVCAGRAGGMYVYILVYIYVYILVYIYILLLGYVYIYPFYCW